MSQLIEALFERFWHVEPVDPGEPGIALRIAFQRYCGPAILLADGSRVEPGDRVFELHMRNDLLGELHVQHGGDRGKAGVAYFMAMRRAMRRLAALWPEQDRFAGAVACFGVSLFPEHLARGGFEVRELLPRWRRRMLSWWTRRVVASFHPEGRARVVEDRRPREVWLVWMSRDTCLRLYGRKGRSAGEDIGEAQGE
jgi:hypothetical protein